MNKTYVKMFDTIGGIEQLEEKINRWFDNSHNFGIVVFNAETREIHRSMPLYAINDIKYDTYSDAQGRHFTAMVTYEIGDTASDTVLYKD